MKIRFLFICFLLAALTTANSGRAESAIWRHANELYRARQYDSAALLYEQLAAPRPVNADLYYNLGNAYYRLNRIGPAVLNYERALFYDPGHRQASDNLLLTRMRMSSQITELEDIFFVRWWRGITLAQTATVWATISFILFLLLVAAMLVRVMATGKMPVPVQAPYLAGFLWILSLFPAFVAAGRSMDSGRAVVMQNDTPLYAALQRGKPLSLLPEGAVVRIETSDAGMLNIVMSDGRTGWVQATFLEKI